MFNEKEREQVNRYLSNQTFTCSIPFFSHDGAKYDMEYRFNIIGEKKNDVCWRILYVCYC